MTRAPAEIVEQAGERRLARVESLRALAALGVVVGHLWAISLGTGENAAELVYGTLPRRVVFGLTYGVWVFFGLTGYLLFWPFVRRWFSGDGRVDLRAYARNRALRILPLYYVSVVGLLLFYVEQPTTEMWWRHLLGLQNFWRESISAVNGPLWSVVVEMQFYALLPALVWGLWKVAGRSRTRAAVVLLVLGAASAFARQRLAIDPDDWVSTVWRFQLPTTFAFFAAGMLLALLRSVWEERPPRGALAHPALWLLAAVPFWLGAISTERYQYELLCVPAVFLTVGAVVLPLRPWRPLAVLDARPLALLGVASYSLYVWHWPAIIDIGLTGPLIDYGFAAVLAGYLPILIAIAAASYFVIERPALRLRRRWAEPSPAPVDLRARQGTPAGPGLL